MKNYIWFAILLPLVLIVVQVAIYIYSIGQPNDEDQFVFVWVACGGENHCWKEFFKVTPKGDVQYCISELSEDIGWFNDKAILADSSISVHCYRILEERER